LIDQQIEFTLSTIMLLLLLGLEIRDFAKPLIKHYSGILQHLNPLHQLPFDEVSQRFWSAWRRCCANLNNPVNNLR